MRRETDVAADKVEMRRLTRLMGLAAQEHPELKWV
eukprot:CAMPEP_0118950316 /NCGR_PEP_ID=MMETSP1169-20130426/51168_1 /TAXON_ID=36882 /ORGANISM="Pyramimonas obovata, Strain CCMP722" /LENGTH=34 /DNA_ID= /DNA_START= /DNA_END= /DNA_ORIENTATION=